MTTIQDLDAIETTHAVQPLTTRQRRFVIAFGIFTALTLAAFLAVTLQTNAAILNLTDSISRGLLHN